MKDEYRNPTIALTLMAIPVIWAAFYAPDLVWAALFIDFVVYQLVKRRIEV